MNLENYDVKDSTHKLLCSHYIGRNGYDYEMDCIFLEKTKSGKSKVIVFGERNWKNRDDKKRVIYVESYRLREIKK